MWCHFPCQWPGRHSTQKLSHKPEAVKICLVTRKIVLCYFTCCNSFIFNIKASLKCGEKKWHRKMINYHEQVNNAKFTLEALRITYVRTKLFHSLLWWLTGSGHSWWVQCWRQTQNKAGSPWPATAYTDLGPVSICQWGCKGCRLGCRKHLQEQVLESDQKLS